jgi:hypothetical protein
MSATDARRLMRGLTNMMATLNREVDLVTPDGRLVPRGTMTAPEPRPEEVLDDALAELRAIEDEMADLESRKVALREVLTTQIAVADGQTIIRPLATVKLTPGSERVTYDRRALDALSASDATLAAILSPHRKSAIVPGGLRVEWRKEARR